MSTLSHTHVRREPTQFRVTVIENDDDLHYLGRTYDIHPYKDGCIVRYIDRDGIEQERVPLLGMYLTEELDQDGQVTRTHHLLTRGEYTEQFVERGDPNLIYGFRAAGGRNVEVTQGTLESTRIGVRLLTTRHPHGQFEVVSLPRDTDTDDSTSWTVVGR